MDHLTKWQKLAREKFGNTTISGDGAFAVRRCYDVVLTNFEMHARQLEADKCDQFCNHLRVPEGGWHRAYLLVEKQVQRKRFRRIDYED